MNVQLETAWSLLVAIPVGLVLVLATWWSYEALRGKARPGARRLFLALRIAAALLLLLLAVEPVVRADRLRTEDARVVILLDTSASMATADSYQDKTRFAAAVELLFEDDGLVEVIEDEIAVTLMRFDTGAIPAEREGLAKARPDGALTDLAGALRSVTARENRTAAVVLITDGAHNAGGDVREAAASLPAPVFAVGLGRPAGMHGGAKDLAVVDVDAPESALVNNAVLVEATIRSSGYDLTDGANRQVRVVLSDGKNEIASENVEISENDLNVRVVLKVVPDREGAFTYRVGVDARGDEENTGNNSRTFTVRVQDRQIAVLYVEGAARWEYKWIKTVLQRDPAIRFTGVVSTGRGTYLVQGEKTTTDLAKGLPQNAEGYEPLDVVILGDIGAASFDDGPLVALRTWVEGGGGLLVLGGYQAFAAGGWGETPLRDLLPVMLAEEGSEQIEAPFGPVVTPEGRNHPILTGIASLFSDEPRPTLEGCSPLGNAKPGATILLENPERGGMAVLAIHRFGEGRVAAFSGDTTYHWALSGRGGDGSGLHERFYGQLVRGLFSPEESVEKSGEPFVIWTDGSPPRLFEEVRVRARVRGEEGSYLDGASVSCRAMGAGGEGIPLTFKPAARLRGHYEARFRPTRPGVWLLSGSASHDGKDIGRAGTRIEVSSNTIESEETGIRDDVLRDVAAASGGRYYPLPASRRIPGDILATLRDEMVREETRLWNAPLLFVLFVGLLGAEWWLRKRNHLL